QGRNVKIIAAGAGFRVWRRGGRNTITLCPDDDTRSDMPVVRRALSLLPAVSALLLACAVPSASAAVGEAGPGGVHAETGDTRVEAGPGGVRVDTPGTRVEVEPDDPYVLACANGVRVVVTAGRVPDCPAVPEAPAPPEPAPPEPPAPPAPEVPAAPQEPAPERSAVPGAPEPGVPDE